MKALNKLDKYGEQGFWGAFFEFVFIYISLTIIFLGLGGFDALLLPHSPVMAMLSMPYFFFVLLVFAFFGNILAIKKGLARRTRVLAAFTLTFITLLGHVGLAVLNDPVRHPSRDALIKGTINNSRAQAELYKDDNGSYLGLCDSSELLGFVDAVSSTDGQMTCVDSENAYRVSSPLPDNEGVYCVDSTGAATTTSLTVSGTSCP